MELDYTCNNEVVNIFFYPYNILISDKGIYALGYNQVDNKLTKIDLNDIVEIKSYNEIFAPISEKILSTNFKSKLK